MKTSNTQRLKSLSQHINESFVNEASQNQFTKTKSFSKFLEEVEKLSESELRSIMNKEYIETPGFWHDEDKKLYGGIEDFMLQNMGKKDFEKLKTYFEKNVKK